MTGLHGFELGVGVATAAIVAAEIKFNYGLGDKVKDLYLWIKSKFVKAKQVASSVEGDVKKL